MNKVVENTPKPVEQPPVTYDLIGLTEDELDAIIAMVGSCSQTVGTFNPYKLYDQLCGARQHYKRNVRRGATTASVERGRP